jgi:hypothetical protein
MHKVAYPLLLLGLILSGPAPSRADDQADMKALLDRATRALGGKANLAKFTGLTVKGKGKIHVGNAFPFSQESYWQMPGKYRVEMNLDIMGNPISEIIVLHGDKGWIKIQNQVARLPKDNFTAFRDVFHAIHLAMRPLDAKGIVFKLSPLGELKIGDQPAVGVKISLKGYPDVDLYMDKKSALPVQSEIRSKDDMTGKEVGHTVSFSDYKKFGDLKSYGKLIWKKDGKKYVEMEITELKPEEKLDADLFAKPQ